VVCSFCQCLLAVAYCGRIGGDSVYEVSVVVEMVCFIGMEVMEATDLPEGKELMMMCASARYQYLRYSCKFRYIRVSSCFGLGTGNICVLLNDTC